MYSWTFVILPKLYAFRSWVRHLIFKGFGKIFLFNIFWILRLLNFELVMHCVLTFYARKKAREKEIYISLFTHTQV